MKMHKMTTVTNVREWAVIVRKPVGVGWKKG